MKSAAILGALLLGVAPVTEVADPKPVATLADGDGGSIHIVKVGDTITVALTTGSDGGYHWVATVPNGVTMVGKPIVKGPNLGPRMVGGMSTTTFTFRMAAAGTYVVRLAERRSWEKNVKPIKTFQFTMKTVSNRPVRKLQSR